MSSIIIGREKKKKSMSHTYHLSFVRDHENFIGSDHLSINQRTHKDGWDRRWSSSCDWNLIRNWFVGLFISHSRWSPSDEVRSEDFLFSYASLLKFRLAHFEYVQANDLERIGLSKPASRRLLAAVKQKQRANVKKPSITVRWRFLSKYPYTTNLLSRLHLRLHLRIPVWYLLLLFNYPLP